MRVLSVCVGTGAKGIGCCSVSGQGMLRHELLAAKSQDWLLDLHGQACDSLVAKLKERL
jgi:hypothetical protein